MEITGRIISSNLEGEDRRDSEISLELPLRDLFAAFALAGLLACETEDTKNKPSANALDAYACADAMLKARNLQR